MGVTDNSYQAVRMCAWDGKRRQVSKEEIDDAVLWSEIEVFLLCSNAVLMSSVL